MTLDALGCERKVAEQIIEKGGDYALAVESNQNGLYDDVFVFMEEALEMISRGLTMTILRQAMKVMGGTRRAATG